jgi:hypothetical protein
MLYARAEDLMRDRIADHRKMPSKLQRLDDFPFRSLEGWLDHDGPGRNLQWCTAVRIG